jgi:hypothetical protein
MVPHRSIPKGRVTEGMKLERIDLDRLLRRAAFFASLNLVGEKDELDFVPIFVIVDAAGRLHAEIVPYMTNLTLRLELSVR